MPNACKVLVVDDDADNRELLVELLDQWGYVGLAAENGAQALTKLEDGLDPDLILTDLMMPVMNGWELCATLKNKPAWSSIPVIVLCGVRPEQRGQLRVNAAFEKPVNLDLLLRQITELCGPASEPRS